MRIVTYDCEVFAYDNLVTFKDKETGQYTCVWNDADAIKACINQSTLYFGFNSKHYDRFIVQAIAAEKSPQDIKKISDYLVKDGQGWQLQLPYLDFNNVDIKDDMQAGLSLKAIEGHLGLPIQETTVPFDIDRPLTAAEKAEVEYYCKHDVDTTEKLIDLRKDYLKNKVNLGKLAGLNEVTALGMTNAKLTAAMLKAKIQPHNDEREYKYPDNLKREYIPKEVFEFFDRLQDKTLTDEEVFKSKMQLNVGECLVTIGFGGIHGAIPHYFFGD